MLDVTILSPSELLFEGRAKQVILPGEEGVFEVLPFHRPIVSRLLPGHILVDGQPIPIWRGVVTVTRDAVTALVETDSPPLSSRS